MAPYAPRDPIEMRARMDAALEAHTAWCQSFPVPQTDYYRLATDELDAFGDNESRVFTDAALQDGIERAVMSQQGWHGEEAYGYTHGNVVYDYNQVSAVDGAGVEYWQNGLQGRWQSGWQSEQHGWHSAQHSQQNSDKALASTSEPCDCCDDHGCGSTSSTDPSIVIYEDDTKTTGEASSSSSSMARPHSPSLLVLAHRQASYASVVSSGAATAKPLTMAAAPAAASSSSTTAPAAPATSFNRTAMEDFQSCFAPQLSRRTNSPSLGEGLSGLMNKASSSGYRRFHASGGKKGRRGGRKSGSPAKEVSPDWSVVKRRRMGGRKMSKGSSSN